jgi:hypothetical protein
MPWETEEIPEPARLARVLHSLGHQPETTTTPFTNKLVTLFAAIALSALNLAAFAVPVAPAAEPAQAARVAG